MPVGLALSKGKRILLVIIIRTPHPRLKIEKPGDIKLGPTHPLLLAL